MRRPEGAVKVVASPGAGGVLLLRAGKGLRGFLLAFAGGGCGCPREGASLHLPAAAGGRGVDSGAGTLAVNPEVRAEALAGLGS